MVVWWWWIVGSIHRASWPTVVDLVPSAWLEPVPGLDERGLRAAYVDFLLARLHGGRDWLLGGAA